ncbi:hypothetical protein AGMMS4952_03360 [Spirochaetia bacterium]|nr:hypothetical protein AGMMS4952_03360 [Spirochaetia bacterium]
MLLMLAPPNSVFGIFFILRGVLMAKLRVNVYIDGFNLYHSTLQHTHPDFRWLNLLALRN